MKLVLQQNLKFVQNFYQLTSNNCTISYWILVETKFQLTSETNNDISEKKPRYKVSIFVEIIYLKWRMDFMDFFRREEEVRAVLLSFKITLHPP